MQVVPANRISAVINFLIAVLKLLNHFNISGCVFMRGEEGRRASCCKISTANAVLAWCRTAGWNDYFSNYRKMFL
jgi:hypothetical protein